MNHPVAKLITGFGRYGDVSPADSLVTVTLMRFDCAAQSKLVRMVLREKKQEAENAAAP
jgi:hypothetical protein